ncbi:MAG: AraC family transcriptional regulator [Rivularia sp. (in: Bacteria)]|nr:AraC family transcriptional regulator [Rivularia sp. MS3]
MIQKNITSYQKAFYRVLDYIDTHLDENLDLEKLSQVAAFSKYHFHRQFTGLFRISLFKYIKLVRLKRASYQLAFRKDIKIIDIAISSGFENHESFTRAFKKNIGQTPSEFRNQPEWKSWNDKYQFLKNSRILQMKSNQNKDKYQVEIVDFPGSQVAVFEHRGNPDLIGNSVQKFIEWSKQNQISSNSRVIYNLVYDDPATTEPEKYRFDICVAVNSNVKENNFGVIDKIIPRGCCAMLRHIGTDENIAETVSYLYREWLPSSGKEPRDFPLFFHRVKSFPDFPEHEMIIDIYLPLKG